MSPYSVLGIAQDADEKTVKSAYRKMVKQYHPDVNPSESAKIRFREIQDAYEAIINGPQTIPEPEMVFRTFVNVQMEVSIEELFHGTTKPLSLNLGSRHTQELSVVIPPMTRPGSLIEVITPAEMGLVLRVFLIPIDGKYRMMGSTLMTRLDVDFCNAILGGEISINTLDGERFFNIEPGTQSGSMVRLPQLGFNRDDGTRDDLVVIINITVPTILTEQQKIVLETYRSLTK